VQVSNCDGAVRFQNCQFNAGITISNCADVRLSNCMVRGRPPANGFGFRNLALSIENSEAVVDHNASPRLQRCERRIHGRLTRVSRRWRRRDQRHELDVLLAGCDVQSGAEEMECPVRAARRRRPNPAAVRATRCS
jgi:hypothetical protein